MKGNKKYAVILVLIIVAFVCKSVYDAHQIKTICEDAVDLIVEEHYKDACDKLECIREENYKDTEALIAYCEANIAYENGNIRSAYWDTYSLHFRYQTSEQKSS